MTVSFRYRGVLAFSFFTVTFLNLEKAVTAFHSQFGGSRHKLHLPLPLFNTYLT